MELAGAFGAGKKKGARSVGFETVVRGGARKKGWKSSCLINSRKWYGKSH